MLAAKPVKSTYFMAQSHQHKMPEIFFGYAMHISVNPTVSNFKLGTKYSLDMIMNFSSDGPF